MDNAGKKCRIGVLSKDKKKSGDKNEARGKGWVAFDADWRKYVSILPSPTTISKNMSPERKSNSYYNAGDLFVYK
jgi:hypothetical protein